MRRTLPLYSAVAFAVFLGACGASDGDVFTLYRSSPLDTEARIHVASFDSLDGGSYNRENCDIAQGLFLKQGGVTARYWCEKGRFRK
ncbi:MAG: hypothetical protein H0X13_19620 [Ramlibacter sp.]|nr:hypothetical protein [Ramlibacter sp.]